MAKFDYDSLREDKIVPLIYKFGTDIILYRDGNTNLWKKEYDPVLMLWYWKNTITGQIVYEEPEPTQQQHEGLCLNLRYREEEADGTNIKIGDRRLMAINIPKPSQGELVKVSDILYNIIRVDEVAPGGVMLFYRIQVRV